MEQLQLSERGRRRDPRIGATWIGAAIVLACGLWLATQGGPAGLAQRTPAAVSNDLAEALGWIDERLALEEAGPALDDPRRACRIASLRWDRAARMAQHAYYRQFGMNALDEREQAYSAFRAQYLRRDASGDVAATAAAARRALEQVVQGPQRARALWFLSMACEALGRRDEGIGALVELADVRPRQAWVWSLLAVAYKARGDQGRLELAEEQGWRLSTGRAPSLYIQRVVRDTPYAIPPPRPAAGPKKP